MSVNVNWDVNQYKEDHESEDQWLLRKAFLLKWKDQYSEERLVCLARVFTNMEFMGCRYPNEVMHEVARMSADVAKQYRSERKTKLQRTFVSASDAAEDKVKGVKRQGGIIVTCPKKKPSSIAFVPQGENNSSVNKSEDVNSHIDCLVPIVDGAQSQITIGKGLKTPEVNTNSHEKYTSHIIETKKFPILYGIHYLEDLLQASCLDPKDFKEHMFDTAFGQFVLVIRPWTDMINNLRSSCIKLKIPIKDEFKRGVFKVTVNNQVLAEVNGDKVLAKARASRIIWDKLRYSTVILLLKEQWISQNDEPISMTDMASKNLEFGEPIEDSVALKMMKLMGWKGGGLGPDSQGIEEPIKPNFRMVSRAGLGHEASGGLQELKRAGLALMRRRGIALDADLVFAADFSTEERAVLHQCANQSRLMSRSYGKGQYRFLVVSNKFQPLSVVRAVVECGGETAKYRVFIPASIGNRDARVIINKTGR